ncbi:NUDIX hydrolase [Stieleria varia]|uniref:Putative NUDIX hydrolase n=1 Tax=Stieleria varia TaxID=2528005 RepID=A0A5C5ZNH9_9BACT|nr:CoA pyrophosphatase [Stieleria varia]TWT87983.1 putative NUDIX hydrolase [Stieleria varia]
MQSRMAAVLVALYQSRQPDHAGRWVIPLTLRPPTMVHHGGQISLPGGRIEPGETPQQAAEREYLEELGLPPLTQQWLGTLSTQYVFGSDHLVQPQVAILKTPESDWRPNPLEVAQVMEVPLAALVNRENRKTIRRRRRVRAVSTQNEPVNTVLGFHFSIPVISVGPHRIWGATAMILDELAQCLLQCQAD